MSQREGQHRSRMVHARSVLVIAAVTALGVGLFTAPASAATATASDPSLSSATITDAGATNDTGTRDTTAVITDTTIVSSGVIKGSPVQTSAALEAARAQAAGVDAADVTAIANSTTCWYWNTQVYYKNILGLVILRMHVQPNWCTTGYWLVSPVYTNTWATINVPGWSFSYTGWHKYGAGWNLYLVHRDGHFCLVQYFSCVQNKYPWIEDEVGPGSRVDYMHYGT
jgi:hypothetical protein